MMRHLLAALLTLSLWCSFFESEFYWGATAVATQVEWRDFFCGYPRRPPPRYLDRGWQLTCEEYVHEHQGGAQWVVRTSRDRCFPASVEQPAYVPPPSEDWGGA